MIDTIALKKLRLSPHNVRKGDTDSQIEPLAQSIAAHGLLSNLLVTATPSKSGYYDVIAGGRRLRALLLLVARGTLKTGFAVPVTILEGSDAHLSETSLAENYHRLAMSPADECRAFAHFLGELGDIDAVAIRFGQTHRQIEARLRLADLAEPIFAELAAGKMTLDCAKAYGATPDHVKQTAVFAQLNGTWQSNNASTIRQAILHGAVRSNDALALYVGQDDYEAAGGRIERELFGDDDSADWIDLEILNAIATTRMATLCEEVRAELGIGWVTPVLEVRVPWEVTQPLHQYYPPRAAPDDSERARIAVIEAEQVTLGDQMNSLDDEAACDLLQSRYDALEAELHALEAARSAIGEDIKPLLGQFLTLSSDGTPRLDPRLFSKTRIGGSDATYVPPADKVKIATRAQGLSDRLVSELAVQRRDILAANLASDPALALDLALFMMADAHGRHDTSRARSTISASVANDPFQASLMPATPASTHLGEISDRLDRSWCNNSDISQRFDAFRSSSDTVRADWLGRVDKGFQP